MSAGPPSPGDSSIGEESSPSGGSGLWEFLVRNQQTLFRLLGNPKAFILGIVIPALISIFILQPLRYAIAFIEWGGALVDGAFGTVQGAIAEGLVPVETTILGARWSPGIIDMVYGSVEGALVNAGLGAPFAATLTAVVFAAVLTVLVYLLIRIALDVIPGGGALYR